MKKMKLVSVMVMALCLGDVAFGAKTNPFIKGLSPAEIATLRRKAPYVDQVYDPQTNVVNYDLVLQRLQDTTKKLSAPEEVFLNQGRRNLQREYWVNNMAKERATNGSIFDNVSRGTNACGL